ncbi:long-chain-fatty-acid--CoA ligase [Paenibacillus ginsengarvi]|uniref:Long-chain fatty acid--CoA ligase n=1 Tax=Paenibacillus ginsengarvi TaxID=400777 RepID=A0A3B0CJJ4_9BACL|nr:long-chain fatty acid--CoA ligase [Paenibacillus ginsengarvi]RKN84166.1 long-chain fatty acid--CoA ligase [Paenibacillus ginsengarvi]
MEQRPWHDEYPLEVPTALDYPSVPLPLLLKDAAERFPEQPALTFFGKKTNYRKLLELCYRFADALSHIGVKPGDRVALLMPNMPSYIISYYGVLFAGAVVVQLNPLHVERELLRHLTDSGADTIVCVDLLLPRIRNISEKAGLKRIIVTSIGEELPFLKKTLYPLLQKRKGSAVQVDVDKEPLFSFRRLLRAARPVPATPDIDPDTDVAVLQYTGGTTGAAKGVMLTHSNLTANVRQCKAWMYRLKEGAEIVLAAVPLFHVYGMTVCMNFGISIGANLLLVPKFEIESLLKTIHRSKPTIFPGAPTMYIAINHHPLASVKYRLSSINCCISGSAPLPLEVQQQFEKLTGGRLVEGYGLSECSPVTHVNPVWEKRKTGSIGVPWPDTDCKIIDPESGEEKAVREIGELVIRGPQVMKGYWNKPEETAKVLEDGWVRTGDMAYMDEEGFFYIVDRKKDMIIAGGYNIFPREVEEVLFEHPDVQEAAVIGVADAYRGETVKAFIVRKAGVGVTEEELNAFCRSKLASYKVPRIYEFRDSLPKTMVGKVLRRELREEEAKTPPQT